MGGPWRRLLAQLLPVRSERMIRRLLSSHVLFILLSLAGCHTVSVPDATSAPLHPQPYRTQKLLDVPIPYHASISHCAFLPDSSAVLFANEFGVWSHSISG